jgi:hypothetical protein
MSHEQQRYYFSTIFRYNQAEGPKKSLLHLHTKLALEDMAATFPSSSRLYAEVNKYLRMNFPAPQVSTQ